LHGIVAETNCLPGGSVKMPPSTIKARSLAGSGHNGYEGFCYLDAGTLGPCRAERPDQRRRGSGAWIMGTLSGGGTERAMVGERRLIGLSLGGSCRGRRVRDQPPNCRSAWPRANPGHHQRRPEPAPDPQRLGGDADPVGALHLGILGSGVQHIAFACDDIFAVVADMRARGAGFLDIPDNYYDDIEAKYDLDAATMAALRANRILYDRDDDREFFQVYTHIFDERFFFEIVERRNNYQGFGAANAAIRLAAQAREVRPMSMPRA